MRTVNGYLIISAYSNDYYYSCKPANFSPSSYITQSLLVYNNITVFFLVGPIVSPRTFNLYLGDGGDGENMNVAATATYLPLEIYGLSHFVSRSLGQYLDGLLGGFGNHHNRPRAKPLSKV